MLQEKRKESDAYMKILKRITRLCVFAMLLLVVGFISGRSEAKAADTYKIRVNKQCCVVNIYKYDSELQKYKAYKAFVCSPGYATPVGTHHLGEKMRWHTLDGPTYGQYCSRITGSILFHSVWYYQPEKNTQSYVQYNKLGTLASHGCVRLTVADAKWIYDNVPSGTEVKVYNSSNPGPFGKPSAIKVSGYQGWDPTDPDPENPYLKKNPTISGVKRIVFINCGDKYNLKAGITAKNSTGFNATSRLKYKLFYKVLGTKEYNEVNEFDTNKVGRYKVLYYVKDEIGHRTIKKSFITVKPTKMIQAFTLNYTEKTLYVGGLESLQSFKLEPKKVRPADAQMPALAYSSAGTKIATVDENGVVTAVSPGKVYITARTTDGSNLSKRCLIVVEQLVTELQMTVPGKTLGIGQSMQARITVSPENATDTSVTYTSSNPAVASVSETGSITGLSVGTTVIKVKANDKSNKVVKIKITVYDPNATDAVSGGGATVPPTATAAGAGSQPVEAVLPSVSGTILSGAQLDVDDRLYA